jgi:hypothetical protein
MITCFAAQIAAQGKYRCHLVTIVRRGSSSHLRKRVPLRDRRVEPQVTVRISLHTDPETVARQKAPLAWQHHIEAWEARMAGDAGDAERRFEAARELAAVRGYRDLSAGQVATLPRKELVARVEAIPVRNDTPDKVEAAAILGGGASEPPITVSRALADLSGDDMLDVRRCRTEKLGSEGPPPNSANKDLFHLEGGPEDHQQA